MDFKQIEAFVNVVRYRSFSKAADATFFTQPTISTHIRNLEKELGASLLDRKGRVVQMTPSGSKFYEYALDMINARAKAFEAIHEAEDTISGILEIQTSSIPGVTFVPEFLSEFHVKHPWVHFYVSLSDTVSVLENITERRGEIGFVGDNVSSNTISSVKVAQDKVCLISPKSYNLKSEVSLKDIIGYPFIWRETGSATRNTFEHTAMSLGYKKDNFEPIAIFDDIDAAIKSVESGLGVSVISHKVASSLSGRVNVSDITDFCENRDFYMIFLKNSSLSPAAESFIEFVLEK